MNKKEINIQIGDINLSGLLNVPEETKRIILFAHGSGSSRLSPRNQFVAEFLNKTHLATLLFDLLTEDEEAIDIYTREFRFDIPLLAKRLIDVTDWLVQQETDYGNSIGYFGSSTGSAAALIAASQRPELINAVVSRGGRPDLAGNALEKIQAPTLLIVGGFDDVVIDLNQKAMEYMPCKKKLEIVPEATHLFEEPGKLEQVAMLASKWFEKNL